MKLELVARKDVSDVELVKNENNSLGIEVRDGRKDEAGPVIKKFKLKSPAGNCFAVAREDVILSLNGFPVVGEKGRDVLRMIKEAGATVHLKLQYDTREIRVSQSTVYRKQQLKIKLNKINGNFGFVLRKKDSKHPFAMEYPVVSNLQERSPIHRIGQILEGDCLLQVDDVTLSWLPLSDIACILQERENALFTFEYKVRVVNFKGRGVIVDLDIDIPTADLGMSVIENPAISSQMYIDSIQKGSIAERCGMFCEGEIILSINEISVTFLSASKANLLLQNAKDCRHISFIPTKRKELNAINAADRNESCGPKENDSTSTSFNSNPVTDWKHVNTPVSSDIGFSTENNSFSRTFPPSEQIKAINKLQNFVQVMTSLKRGLSRLHCGGAFEKKQEAESDKCMLCCGTQQSVNLCSPCLAKMNTKCAQSMDFLRSIITRFIAYSTNLENVTLYDAEKEMVGNAIDEITFMKVSAIKGIHTITEIFPDAFPSKPDLIETLKALTGKISNSDASCRTCDNAVKSVSITVQKLLLLLSLADSSVEMNNLINELVYSLAETKFDCDTYSHCHDYSFSSEDSFRSENFPLPSFTDEVSSEESEYTPWQTNTLGKSSETKESSETNESNKSSLNIPQVKINMEYDHLTITPIKSSGSGQSDNESEFEEASKDNRSVVENDDTSLEVNVLESSQLRLNSKDSTTESCKVYGNKGLRFTPAKVWRSLDSFLKPKLHSLIRNESTLNPNKSEVNGSNVAGHSNGAARASFRQHGNRLSPVQNIVKKDSTSESNSGSTRSSFRRLFRSRNRTESKKTRTDTVNVKMTNNGEGFGLSLGMRCESGKTSSSVPVIQAIKPKSPSRMSGILKVEDRIVAINHQSTLGLTPQALQSLKNSSFSAEDITLTVEFDVVDTELKFGTFDVVLDKSLKIGLIFEDMRRGFPMVVSGIVKGSGGHRCGQLFPRDKIKFFRCIRTEEFDPVSCNYSREESVLITVQRDPIQEEKDLRKKPADASPCYSNPSFSHQDSVPRRGRTFVVRRTAIHAVDGSDSLVLDREITLFRDPVSWDFGILVGENPVTGRAYITDVRDDGPAGESGVVKKFDRIMEINGVPVDGNIENSVLTLLSKANHKVDLLIRRLYHENSDDI